MIARISSSEHKAENGSEVSIVDFIDLFNGLGLSYDIDAEDESYAISDWLKEQDAAYHYWVSSTGTLEELNKEKKVAVEKAAEAGKSVVVFEYHRREERQMSFEVHVRTADGSIKPVRRTRGDAYRWATRDKAERHIRSHGIEYQHFFQVVPSDKPSNI